eukprot:c35034_g1_i1 orf=177-446(+)
MFILEMVDGMLTAKNHKSLQQLHHIMINAKYEKNKIFMQTDKIQGYTMLEVPLCSAETIITIINHLHDQTRTMMPSFAILHTYKMFLNM